MRRSVAITELWSTSGFALLNRDPDGRLKVTDDFLRAYLGRPELAPVEESCARERALHSRLLAEPRASVDDHEINGLADPDAQDNYRVVLDFRNRLLAAGSIEACYLSVFADQQVTIAPLFIDQMTQVIVRNIIDGTDDPFRARAAELLFREQTVTLHEGAILLGDSETVDMLSATGGLGNIGKLLAEGGVAPRQIEMDVLQPETATMYWQRNERFDTVLDLSFARHGIDALCRVLEDWVRHFLQVDVSIQPVQKISDEKWVWHIGLDAEATALLNDLYEDVEVSDDRMSRLLSLFRLEFQQPELMRPEIAGRPIYLALAMTADKKVRLKPQNLLVNLPLATPV